ncbi:MAG: hypothetical protein DRN15_03925 [Thermoprotei archaeon]|nr:MAG: hypothetical protein DRN15_03925 [Thermoprotei archaeon]
MGLLMLRVGVAKVDITPPIGTPMGGYGSRVDVARGIHDRLHARAMILSDGTEELAIVSMDLLYTTREMVEEARRLIREYVGISEDHVAIVATHTHSGPGLDNVFGRLDEYCRLLPHHVLTSISLALESMRSARFGCGTGYVYGLTINRRDPLHGPLDEQLIVARFEDEERRLVGALVNFTCHAVVLGHTNLYISADYPGYVCEAIENIENGVVLFLNGACGDINPLVPSTFVEKEKVYDRSKGTFEEARKMGYAIAGETLQVINKLRTVEDVKLVALSAKVSIRRAPIPSVTEEDIESLSRELEEALRKEDKAKAMAIKHSLVFKRWLLEARKMFPKGYVDVELQVIRIGDLILALIPGEPLVRLGLKLKSLSPAKVTAVIGYANGYVGYIPTKEDMKEAGYETTPPACILSEEAEDKIMNALLELIDRALEV